MVDTAHKGVDILRVCVFCGSSIGARGTYADAAASLGRETLPFKRDVRKLKELGLTRSLPVGYEISHRGRAYLG